MPTRPPWEPSPVPPALLAAARTLRASMTDAEQLLWQCLRGKQLDGFKFRKQHPFHQYVLDFYCPSAKLAIELDGGQHNTDQGRQRDAERTAFLNSHEIRVIRFWNDQLLQQSDTVLTAIWQALHAAPPHPTITPPTLQDAPALLAFELANRNWFESWVTARAPGYYSMEGVQAAIELAMREAVQDRAHQFLIKSNNQILGRVNLTQIEREYFNKAMLGYRIGEAFCGQGVARLAVAQVLEKAFGELRLWRVEATVREGNRGSTRVLQHNGFQEFGRATRAMKFDGAWSDLIYFERHATSTPEATSPHRA